MGFLTFRENLQHNPDIEMTFFPKSKHSSQSHLKQPLSSSLTTNDVDDLCEHSLQLIELIRKEVNESRSTDSTWYSYLSCYTYRLEKKVFIRWIKNKILCVCYILLKKIFIMFSVWIKIKAWIIVKGFEPLLKAKLWRVIGMEERSRRKEKQKPLS